MHRPVNVKKKCQIYFLYTELSHSKDVDIHSVYMAMSVLKSCDCGMLRALFLDSSVQNTGLWQGSTKF